MLYSCRDIRLKTNSINSPNMQILGHMISWSASTQHQVEMWGAMNPYKLNNDDFTRYDTFLLMHGSCKECGWHYRTLRLTQWSVTRLWSLVLKSQSSLTNYKHSAIARVMPDISLQWMRVKNGCLLLHQEPMLTPCKATAKSALLKSTNSKLVPSSSINHGNDIFRWNVNLPNCIQVTFTQIMDQ